MNKASFSKKKKQQEWLKRQNTAEWIWSFNYLYEVKLKNKWKQLNWEKKWKKMNEFINILKGFKDEDNSIHFQWVKKCIKSYISTIKDLLSAWKS